MPTSDPVPRFTLLILAGGKGTRLGNTAGDVPKPLAPVAGRPFLHHLLDVFAATGPSKIVLSVGHKAESIIQSVGTEWSGCPVVYGVEDATDPLGTGGGVLASLPQIEDEWILLANGDSYWQADYSSLCTHLKPGCCMAMGLAWQEDTSRFGTVEFAPDNRVARFIEKSGQKTSGWIHAGVSLIRRKALLGHSFPKRCSWEQDIIPRLLPLGIMAVCSKGVFLDIGTPDDYGKAATILAGAGPKAGE